MRTTIKEWIKTPTCKCFLMFVVFIVLTTQPAFADLISGMDDLQSKVKSMCQPIAIIFLIIAGWQKAMGNSQLFVAALIGTVVMFASPQIVDFVSASFGR